MILREERPSRSDQGVPVHNRRRSDSNESSVVFFGGRGERRQRAIHDVSVMPSEKTRKLFQIEKCRGSGAELFVALLVHTASCSLSAVTSSVLVSLRAAVRPWCGFTPEQHRIASVCSLSFCRRMFLPIENQIFSLSKMRWLQTPTGFLGFFFFWRARFQKRAGILPVMSTVTSALGKLFFSLVLYILSLISDGREPTGIYHSVSRPASPQQLPAFV